MDSDTTEIAIRVRQVDGSYQVRWMPLRDLAQHIERATLITIRDLFADLRADLESGNQADGSPAA